MLLNPYRFGGDIGEPDPFLVEGVRMNVGADNNGFMRTAQLTGAADSKMLSFACWARITTWENARILFENFKATNNQGLATVTSPFGFRCAMPGASTSTVLNIRTSSTLVLNKWYCLMGSVDLSDTAKRHLYIGDNSELSVSSYTNEAMDFTVAKTSAGISENMTGELLGALAELWWAPGRYIDFSNVVNRRKFFSSTGKPVDLGANGELPTGTAPAVYLSARDGELVSAFATNRGTGGNYTLTGAPALAATSPSD